MGSTPLFSPRQVTIPLCLLPPETRLGSIVELAATVEPNSHRDSSQTMIELQHSLISTSLESKCVPESVLVWRGRPADS